MVIRASLQNPTTSKRTKDDRVCNIHHFVDGKLARMEDFRGMPFRADRPAVHFLVYWSPAEAHLHQCLARLPQPCTAYANTCARDSSLAITCMTYVSTCAADPRQIIAANQAD